MVESFKQGIVGLLLFAQSWFIPNQEMAAISVESIRKTAEKKFEIHLKMNMAINQQMEQLIDAGIPLHFKIEAKTDVGNLSTFYRTMQFDVIKYNYHYSDSAEGLIRMSKDYPMILLALKDFSQWEFLISKNATVCFVEVTLLPSRVTQLNRTVDMSKIWGQQKVNLSFQLTPKEKQ
jgi:hypothetical protein